MPITTTPLPIGITSPPSRVANPWSARTAVEVAQPHVVRRVGEGRVEPVDRRRQQRLLPPGRPEHRVQGDALEDPGGVVPREQRVRQRRQDEPRLVGAPRGACSANGPPNSSGTSRQVTPPIRNSASRAAGSPSSQARTSWVRPGPTRSSVILRSRTQARPSGMADHVGQQVVRLEHLDPAVAHLGDELEVVPLGAVHPDHVVEEQARRRCPA